MKWVKRMQCWRHPRGLGPCRVCISCNCDDMMILNWPWINTSRCLLPSPLSKTTSWDQYAYMCPSSSKPPTGTLETYMCASFCSYLEFFWHNIVIINIPSKNVTEICVMCVYVCVSPGSFKSSLSSLPEAEELYQKRVLTITGICIALLVVGIMCVVAYCKTK